MLDELVGNPRLLYRHTVNDYHRMLISGAIEEGEPYELLDGHVVRKMRSAAGDDPMTVGHDHTTAVMLLAKVDRKLEKLACHIRTQQPITLTRFDEPEPDGAIVAGTIADYSKRHPRPADVCAVIEVADASLIRDRAYKQRIYADSGIPVYVIINLPDRIVEFYTQPMKGKGRYGQSTTLTPRQTLRISLLHGKEIVVPVRTLLP